MASSGGQSSGPGTWGAEVFEARITRRRLLRSAAATGLALGAGGILAACGGDDDDAAVGTATGGGATEGPTTGGRLRIGHVGAGKGESFNPARGSSFIDASRYFNVFDPLSRVSPELEVEPGLALEWTPNSDSTVWEVKLRPDVTWHDGKPFTADDVIYTFGEMADAKHVSHASVTNINAPVIAPPPRGQRLGTELFPSGQFVGDLEDATGFYSSAYALARDRDGTNTANAPTIPIPAGAR